MDLRTTYLGLNLPHPLMPGASPMVDKLDLVKRLEDAGAAAIVMHSLFEEQVTREEAATIHHIETHEGTSAEALSFFPRADEFHLAPDQYLEQIVRVKQTVGVPVIGSINGFTTGGWIRYAKLIQEAGANALELNVYYLATSPKETGTAVENRTLDILKAVKGAVSIPVAVKISPFYSSIANIAHRLDEAGADGLVLFNRFYQPDIDVEALEVEPVLQLSDSSELNLRLRWLAIVSGQTRGSLAVSGGVHTPLDAIKAVMTGANAVQVVSAILRNGPDVLRQLREGMTQWLETHDYESLEQARGSMNLLRTPEPAAYERANYIRLLQGYKV